ncbi:copper-binding protein [Alkalimarinus alittae]|uniref:Copper-binding protein n=1 Tax=Alkalimarinus alittae TaxID=2961619 RepID=A0ABY6MXH3_9ALTE|nr:copper-binding protein [Alkalimarinus alittae]UZE94524.1 copper-binding protein [Alkalimarinus alittae]
MEKFNTTKKSKLAAAAIIAGVFFAPGLVSAGAGHGHEGGGHMESSKQGEHMNKEQKMTHVMGNGRINKVMAKGHMVNISHEPISELNWPKMRMNFKTSDKVNLGELKPGQKVQFKLQVDQDNNYLINEIHIVK